MTSEWNRRGGRRRTHVGAVAFAIARLIVFAWGVHAAADIVPAGGAAGGAAAARKPPRPNVVIVLADDMGYGDVACYDPQHSKFPTRRIDALARQGMRFTDAHSTSAVCSPSRYSLLTGRYHWRAGLKVALPKWAKPVIPPGRLTLPRLLKQNGYHTACVGKWHLGFDWPKNVDGGYDFTKPLGGGPLAAGFDTYFGVDVPNFPPFTFIENDRIPVQPTEHQAIDKEMIVNHEGAKAPGWRFDRIVPTLVDRSVQYIEQRAAAAAGEPFFLYVSLTSPHYPIAPSEAFRGESGINPLADFIMETDAAVGAVADALDRTGLGDNTLLIFTTDNGHDPVPGLKPFQEAGHRVSGPFRGQKFTIAEGGHRVPFVVRWPAVIKPRTEVNQTVCHADLVATCAEAVGVRLPDDAGEDSVSLLPLLRGQPGSYGRPAVVHHAPDGAFAIREGEWKLIWIPAKGEAKARMRLYNVQDDPSEGRDRQGDEPDRVRAMTALMERFIRDGRSTPGAPQKNDADVVIPGSANSPTTPPAAGAAESD